MVRTPRQDRARETVEVLLEATAQLLREGAPFSTNRIARRAGVSIGSLYQYFVNKEALVLALAEERRQILLRRLVTDLGGNAALTDRIETAVLGLIDVLGEDPPLQVALTREVVAGDLQPLLGDLPQVAALVGAVIAQQPHLHVDDPAMTARILVTSVVGSVHGALLEDPRLLAAPSFRAGVVGMVRRTLGL